MYVEEAIVIEVAAAVTTLPVTKIFPLEADENVSAPYMVYMGTDKDRIMTHTGFDGLTDAHYQIDLYHTTYSNLKVLMAAVIAEIKTFYRSTIGSTFFISDVGILDQVETYDPETQLFQGTFSIMLTYREEEEG